MADAGDLEKLPLEIRNEIYFLALVPCEPLTLINFGGDQRKIGRAIGPQRMKLDNEWARSDKAKIAPENHERRHNAIGYQPIGKNKWLKVTSNVALLCVNKQVYAEAVPVLYGRTRFQFENPVTLRNFLKLIGDKQQHLRSVSIDSWRSAWHDAHTLFQARHAMEELAAAKGIRTLGLAHSSVCPMLSWPGFTETVKMCKPLLDSLKTASQENNLNIDILEVLRIMPITRWHSHCSCSMEDLQRMLKREVSEQHELALE